MLCHNCFFCNPFEGEIEAEQAKAELLTLRRDHSRLETLMQGEGEAARIRSFFEGLGDELSPAQKVDIFNSLQKYDTLEKLSTGRAQLYFTPADVDLSIEARTN